MNKLPIVIGLHAVSKGLLTVLLGLAAVIVSIDDAIAFRLDYSTDASMRYSDNINQTSENEEEEWVGSGVIGINLEQESASVIVDANAFLRYEDFVNDTFSDRFTFSLNNQTEWRIIPERFSWTLEDYYTQVSIDSLDPATPDNTQNTNAFSTGPDYVLRFGPINRLEAGLRYEDIYFEETDADNRRYSVFATWFFTPASTKELSLNLSGEKVDFDNEGINENFTREDFSLAFTTRYPRYTFRAELGGTSIQSDELDNFGYLARVAGTWNLTSRSTLAISAESQLTDTGRNLLEATTDLSQDNLQIEQVSGDVFRQEEIRVAYTKAGDSLRGELNANWIDRDYENTPLDRVIKGVGSNIEYNFTATLIGTLFGDYDQTRERSTNRVDKDSSVGLGLIYFIRRNLSLGLTAQYFRRNSNLLGASFREISGLLGIAYGIGENPGRRS